MCCSSAKRPGEGSMPAIDRYDGPVWRTRRAALAELGEDCRPEIWFLSARYGFHPADMPIADYEQRMTPSRAAELLRLPTSNHAAFAEAARGADRRSEEHTSELQSLMRNSYAVFCLKKKKNKTTTINSKYN